MRNHVKTWRGRQPVLSRTYKTYYSQEKVANVEFSIIRRLAQTKT
jgi:hypothetical protein